MTTKQDTSSNASQPRLKRANTQTNTQVAQKAKTSTKSSKADTAKAAEQVKKPTVKELQVQVDNLTEQLMYANAKCSELQEKYTDEHRFRIDTWTALRVEQNRSWWDITKERFLLLFV